MKGIVTWGVPRIPNHQSKPSGEFFHLEVVFCRRRDRCLYCAFADFFAKSATCHLFRCVFCW